MILDYIFRRKKVKANNSDDFIFFHEDDYCQVEIVTASNRDSYLKEIEQIQEFADEHSDGIGYTDMYIRQDNQCPTADMKISFQNIDKNISCYLHKFNSVKTGYSSYACECESTVGYGFKELSIFLEHENEIVKNIWITGFARNQNHLETFTNVLEYLGKLDLILVDWNVGIVVNLNDKEEIEKYLSYGINDSNNY